jgi:hypothetical protein
MDLMVTVYGTRQTIHRVIRRVVQRARDGNQIGPWRVAAPEDAAYERDDGDSCEGSTSVGDDRSQVGSWPVRLPQLKPTLL